MASPEVNVRIRATDGASPVLTLIQGNLARTAASGALAARGMDRVTDAVKDIGRQAAGVDRDVGNLAVGLINLAGGGTLVTAAVGATMLAFTAVTSKSRELNAENDRIVDQLAKEAEGFDKVAEAARGSAAALDVKALATKRLGILEGLRQGLSLVAGVGGAQLASLFDPLVETQLDRIAAGVKAEDQIMVKYNRDLMETFATLTGLGLARDQETRAVRAYVAALQAEAHLQSASPQLRRAAADEAKRLADAMGKTVEKGQNLAQSLAEQVNYYGQLAQLHPLTSQQLDELSGVLNAVTAAEQDANTTRKDAIALLGAERQALALLGGEAAKQAEKDLRASVGRSPFTAPQRPADGRSLTPFAVPDGLIDTRSIISPSLVQGLEAGMDETIRSLDKTLAKAAREAQFTQIQQGFAQSISQSITDGITAGFDTALASGDIGAGFGALIGALLSGIGTAMEQFGAAALVASQFMQAIMSSLMALDPSGSAAAAIGMIAMGAVFKALGNAASSAFGGGGSAGSGGGGYSGGGVRGRDEAETTRIIVQTPASAHATSATQMRPLHFTVIGTDSAKAQREIKELIRNADARAA
jgi:hypothetical protein